MAKKNGNTNATQNTVATPVVAPAPEVTQAAPVVTQPVATVAPVAPVAEIQYVGAKDMSREKFLDIYYNVYRNNGTFKDLFKASGMTNQSSVRQKIVALKKDLPDLPTLQRSVRGPNGGKTASQRVRERWEQLKANGNASQASAAPTAPISNEQAVKIHEALATATKAMNTVNQLVGQA